MIELRYCEECACFLVDACRSGHKTLAVEAGSGSNGYVIVQPKEMTPKPPNDNPSQYNG